MKVYEPSFFDESKRLAALSRLKDPLEQLGKHIDFEIFRSVLTDALRNPDRKSPAGRKPLDVILMFKALIIQRLFNLSDEQLEFQITDRLSFTRFLGLHIGETIPDYTSFWGFREALAEKGLERELFELFSSKLEAEGFLPRPDRSSMPRLWRFHANAIPARRTNASRQEWFQPNGMKTKAAPASAS